jgi:hypothetical protein
MIVYHHPTSVRPPHFLEGARELCASAALEGGYFFGVGPHYLCGFPKGIAGVVELDGGWKAAIVGAVDPFFIQREIIGQPTVCVEDISSRIWQVPVIINEDGTRAFPVRYGSNWKPVLTEQQTQLVEFAREARNLMPRLLGGSNVEREELMPVACSYAAAAIAYANHISPEVLEKLNLIDTSLVAGVLTVMCNYVIAEPGNG